MAKLTLYNKGLETEGYMFESDDDNKELVTGWTRLSLLQWKRRLAKLMRMVEAKERELADKKEEG